MIVEAITARFIQLYDKGLIRAKLSRRHTIVHNMLIMPTERHKPLASILIYDFQCVTFFRVDMGRRDEIALDDYRMLHTHTLTSTLFLFGHRRKVIRRYIYRSSDDRGYRYYDDQNTKERMMTRRNMVMHVFIIQARQNSE